MPSTPHTSPTPLINQPAPLHVVGPEARAGKAGDQVDPEHRTPASAGTRNAYGTTCGFGSIRTIQSPEFMSLRKIRLFFTTTPHVIVAFGIFPCGLCG